MAELSSRQLALELSRANGELQQALAQALLLSTRDPLTRTLNRRAFLERADIVAATMRRHREPACILMLDLDDFKAVNDGHGHAVGDEVLAAASGCIQTCLREVDVLARWGGEEFIVLLPQTGLAGGQAVAERIRAEVERLSAPGWPPQLRVTVSIGVAAWAHEAGVDQSVKQADQALYRAKLQGRNRVEPLPA